MLIFLNIYPARSELEHTNTVVSLETGNVFSILQVCSGVT
jgi:hypothetical protein